MQDRYRKFQISALDRVQNKAGKFAYHSGGTDWETLAQRRKIGSMCTVCKSYTGIRAWKEIEYILLAPRYLRMVNHYWKVRARKQRPDIGKYSFVIRSITDWYKLHEVAKLTTHGKAHIFKTTVKKVKSSEGK
jgi:hypothetical protein